MKDSKQIAIIQVGNKNKVKMCPKQAHIYYYEDTIPEEELVNEIIDLQDFYDGIIVQLPLPPHITQAAILSAIDPAKDVEGLIAAALYDPAN